MIAKPNDAYYTHPDDNREYVIAYHRKDPNRIYDGEVIYIGNECSRDSRLRIPVCKLDLVIEVLQYAKKIVEQNKQEPYDRSKAEVPVDLGTMDESLNKTV